MKIAIDTRWIFDELSGIGTYTQELVRHLAQHDRENQYVLFFHRQHLLARTAELTLFNTAPNFTTRLLRYGPFSPRGQLLLPGLLSDMKVDVFHSTNYMIPFRAFPRNQPGRTRCVITIHDLIPLIFPDHAPKSKKSRLFPLFKGIMIEAGKRADIIVTVSKSSRRDVIRYLRIPPRAQPQVVVIPEGVAPHYKPGATHVGEQKTILYVGRFDPYKNLVPLVEAFARLHKTRLPNARLRIIGPEDPRYPEARQRARELGVEDDILWSGYVPGDTLKDAYQSADVLVLPSKYEGFGLPVLEAMACGTPVVCSNTSSLPEVAGEAAILVDPDNLDQLAEALVRVLSQTSTARDLREKGVKQAAKFTWARTARLTIQAYEMAMGEGESQVPSPKSQV